MKARRENGKLLIEIDEQCVIDGVNMSPQHEDVKVINREEFLSFCADQICDFGDTGDFNSCSHMTRLLDHLITHAVESAAGCEC